MSSVKNILCKKQQSTIIKDEIMKEVRKVFQKKNNLGILFLQSQNYNFT